MPCKSNDALMIMSFVRDCFIRAFFLLGFRNQFRLFTCALLDDCALSFIYAFLLIFFGFFSDSTSCFSSSASISCTVGKRPLRFFGKDSTIFV